MNIIVEDISSYIQNPRNNPKALGIVRDVCRARPKGYKFMKKYRNGTWDGYISLMHSYTKFPTGLLSLIIKRLDSSGHNIKVIDKRRRREFVLVDANSLYGVTLRDYQIDAANILLEKGNGIAKMATNSGKTEVMASMIGALQCNSVIILHRKELMYQTVERLELRLRDDPHFSGNIGMIGDGHWNPDLVTVAMIQTLHSKFNRVSKTFPDNIILMADECHHVSSDQMMDVMKIIPGRYRYGFSGTPLKYDLLSDMKLVSATGDVETEVTNDYLIRAGYSAQPTVYISTIESVDIDVWGMEYQDAYKELIVWNKVRNDIIASIARDSSGTVLILVSRIEHGDILCDMINESIFVNGNDTTEYRKQVLDSMREYDGVYIASPIFSEGIDVPNIDVLIIADGGKDYKSLLQKLGRGMRKKSGDNMIRIYDFIDDTNMYLLSHSDSRIDWYVKEKFRTELLQTANCRSLQGST